MSDTATLKPGATLTAAQANSLPVGSVVDDPVAPRRRVKMADKKWRYRNGDLVGNNGELTQEKYTLLRVGPAAFAVGEVVTKEQARSLPAGSKVMNPHSTVLQLKDDGGWYCECCGKTTMPSTLHSASYTIISLPSTNPHAPGSLDWARWAAQNEGVCIKCDHEQCKFPWRFKDGEWQFYRFGNHWYTALVGVGQTIESVLTGWSIVPDPSLPSETPVETSEETEEHMCLSTEGALDEFVPKWRTNGWAVAEAVRELGLYYRMYESSDRLKAETIATLTAERDSAISEIGKSCAIMAKSHAEEIKGIKAERDAEIAGLEKERDELLGRCARAEADWQAACSEHGKTRAELRAAKVVVPEDVRNDADRIISRKDGGYTRESVRCARFIISLADHIASVGKMVQSAHPEGSREWAEDAMRAGRGVTVNGDSVWYKKDTSFTKDEFRSQEGAWWQSDKMALTGWRIHTPAVAPSAEPSVVKLAASIEALNERIDALEAGQ